MPPTPAQVTVPKPEEQKVERPASSRFLSPKPQTERPPFVIRLMGPTPA